MRHVIHLCVLAGATIGAPALADLTATYTGPGGAATMRVEAAGNGDLRVSTSNPNTYFIQHDGHGYVVQATFDGPAVMRVEDIVTAMDEQVRRFMPTMPEAEAASPPAFPVIADGAVTVRGRRGTAYNMTPPGHHMAAEQPVVVISEDPALTPLGIAFRRQFDISVLAMARVTHGINPMAVMQAALARGTPLLFTGFELVTLSAAPIDPAHFALPAAALPIDRVRTTLGVPPTATATASPPAP